MGTKCSRLSVAGLSVETKCEGLSVETKCNGLRLETKCNMAKCMRKPFLKVILA